MKTFISLAILFILTLFSINSKAQFNHIGYQVPDSIFNNEPFAQLDTSRFVSSGVLWDRINPNFNFEAFQGRVDDSATNSSLFYQSYLDIKSAFINPNLFTYYEYQDEYSKQALARNALPIVCYSVEYQKLKNYALDSGLVHIVDSQFVLNPSSTENPMLTQYLWQISTSADIVPINKAFNVVLPQFLSISNLTGSKRISSMSINFDDGVGYRTAHWDSLYQIQYSGESDAKKIVRLKFTNQEGHHFYALLKWKTATSSNCYPDADDAPWADHTISYNYSTGLPFSGHQLHSVTRQVKHLFEASTPYLGEKALGKAYIKYRYGASTTQTQFNKPLIFIEGIDFSPPYQINNYSQGSQYDPLQNSVRMGNIGWPSLWGCDNDNLFEKAPPYLDSLRNEGYDIIMLDFYHGADYMQRNAFLLIELINRINQNKISDEQIVILGASMGGQVARWALNYMEHNNLDHCVRLFCSFDSPWKGAHIPLSLQSFIKYMSEDANKAVAKQRLKDLRWPATRQMLLYHIDACDANYATKTKFGKKKWNVSYNFPNQLTFATDSLFDQFYQEAEDLGDYPKACRNVAMVNGNSQGIREFNNGQRYLHSNKTCWGLKNKVVLYAEGASNNIISELNTGGIFKEVWEKRYKTFNSQKLDNCPGGYRSDFSEIQESLKKFLTDNYCPHTPSLDFNRSTFIPVASALALENDDWNYRLDQQIGPNSSFLGGLTKFESFHAPLINEPHVLVSNENMNWFINQIRRGEPRLENHNNGKLSKTWNNPIENKRIGGLDINSGGTLYINADRPIYDETPEISRKNFPPVGGFAKLIIGNSCSSNTTVNINLGGKIILGDNNFQANSTNNRAEVHVGKDGVLNINDGGELTIHKGSLLIIDKGGKLSIKGGGEIDLISDGKIIVEEGGELEFHKNGQIQLLTDEGILHIKGKLSVESHATFTILGQGKIIMDQAIPWLRDSLTNQFLDLNSYMRISAGAKFKLNGGSPSNKSKTILECRRPFYLKDAAGGIFEEVDILNGAVELNNGALFFSFGKTFISNSTIKSDGNQNHGGIRIWNNGSHNLIRNTDIQNGDIGVFAQGFTGANSLNFDNCEFSKNNTALKINGGSFNYSNGRFFDNNLNIKGEALSGESRICFTDFDNSNWNVRNQSILITGQQGSLLNINNCLFKNYSTFIRAVGIDLRSDCSEYNGSNVGINLEDGILYINEDAGNIFKQNASQSILLTGNTTNSGIFLKNGHNIFEKDNGFYNRYFRHIDAYFPGGIPQSDFLPNHFDVDADFNSFDIYNPFNHPENFFFFLSYNGNIPTYHNVIFNNNSSNADCNSPSATLEVHPLGPIVEQFPSGGGMINFSGANENISLKQATLEGIDQLSLVDEEKDDLGALNRFLAVLNANIQQSDGSTNGILQANYKGAFNAINNAYQYDKLSNSEGSPGTKPIQLTELIQIIDNKISSLAPALDSNDRPAFFQFHLDKVHAYRVSGFYSDAIFELNNSINWTFSYKQQQRAGYWNCVCNSELEYHLGEFREESFMYQMDQCHLAFAGYNYKNEDRVLKKDNNQNEIFESHPQPVRNEITLFVNPELNESVNIKIINTNGQIIYETKVIWEGNTKKLDLSHLKPGAYFLSLETSKFSRKIKILKS